MITFLRSDLLKGYVYGLLSIFAIGLWGLWAAWITAGLWAAGGAGLYETKAWRRVGCPLLICSAFFPLHHLGAAVSFVLQFGAFSIGYGVPSAQPPDAGSWLGRTFGDRAFIIWALILAVVCVPMFL